MPRTSRNASLDEIIRSAVEPVVARAAAAIARTMAELSAERASRRVASRGRKQQRRRPQVDMTVWTADRRARRVPKFVIEATGLDTKKKIVAKFGDGVTFHKGKPLPAARKTAGQSVSAPAVVAARQVKARPPRIRKAARTVSALAGSTQHGPTDPPRSSM